MAPRPDLAHAQFCSMWRNPEGRCDCFGVKDRRLLLEWERAIAGMGEEIVMERVKMGLMEPAPTAGHMVGTGLWYFEDEGLPN